MSSVPKKLESDVRRTLDFFGAVKRALFPKCRLCLDTGKLRNGQPCTCDAGVVELQGELVKDDAPTLPSRPQRQLPRGK